MNFRKNITKKKLKFGISLFYNLSISILEMTTMGNKSLQFLCYPRCPECDAFGPLINIHFLVFLEEHFSLIYENFFKINVHSFIHLKKQKAKLFNVAPTNVLRKIKRNSYTRLLIFYLYWLFLYGAYIVIKLVVLSSLWFGRWRFPQNF